MGRKGEPMKCDNCSNDAAYTVADPGVNPVNYCATCLPTWLQDRALAGHFPVEKAAPAKKKAEAKEAPADADNLDSEKENHRCED